MKPGDDDNMLVWQLKVLGTTDGKLFNTNFVEGQENVSSGNWIVERYDYAYAVKSNSTLLCLNQN